MRLPWLAVVLLLVVANAAAERPRRAVWVWDNSVTETTTQRDALLKFCRERNIDTLFLHAPMDHLQDRPDEFHAFLAAAHRQKIRVEALDGNARWAFERAGAENFVTAVKIFNSFAKTPQERFDGIHLDAEPYDTLEWKQDEQRVAAQYLEMLDALRAQKGDLLLTADVPPWFGSFNIPEGTLLSGAITRTDGIALMSYTNQVRGLAAEVKPALEFAATKGKRVWIGLSVQAYDSDMDGTKPLRPQVERTLKRAEKQFGKQPALAGIALHDFGHLRALYDKR